MTDDLRHDQTQGSGPTADGVAAALPAAAAALSAAPDDGTPAAPTAEASPGTAPAPTAGGTPATPTAEASPSAATPAPSSAPAQPPAPGPGEELVMPEYKGGELDAERGPGLGCFWIQVALLAFFIVLTPVSVELGWPPEVSAILLFVVLGLLLFVGQTVIFLLRIVAAERRGRRRPLASASPTVGEIEEAAEADTPAAAGERGPADTPAAAGERGPADTPAAAGERGPADTPAAAGERGPADAAEPPLGAEAAPAPAPAPGAAPPRAADEPPLGAAAADAPTPAATGSAPAGSPDGSSPPDPGGGVRQ